MTKASNSDHFQKPILDLKAKSPTISQVSTETREMPRTTIFVMQKKPKEDSMQKERAKATGMEMPTTKTNPNTKTMENPNHKLSTVVGKPETTLQAEPKVDNVRKEMTKVTGMEMPSMPTTNTDPNLSTKKNPMFKLPTVVDTQDTTFTTTTEQTNSDDEMLEIALVMEKERMTQEQEDNDFLEAALLLEATNL